MNKRILIDLGSSSAKFYLLDDSVLHLLFYRTIPFKEGFSPEKGIADEQKKELFDLFIQITKNHPGVEVHVYATAIYRKLAESAKQSFISECKKMGVDVNIISPELENEYLEMALVGKYDSEEPIMLENIGGGSTEILIVKNGIVKERLNIDQGVGTIMTKYPTINDDHTICKHREMVEEVKMSLPEMKEKPFVAICSGGELTWMRLGNYNLVENTVFSDPDHPLQISLSDYKVRNKEIFETVTLPELEKLMPENPRWMSGAKSYNVLSEALCEKYGIQILIPSDSNLINGVVRRDFSSDHHASDVVVEKDHEAP